MCDVTEENQREGLRDWAVERFPDLNILMNNAGIQHLTDLTKPVDLKNVRLEIETNVVAPIHLTSLFAAHLAERPAAAFINISSGLAFTPRADRPVYCATKAAVHSLTLALRRQLRLGRVSTPSPPLSTRNWDASTGARRQRRMAA